MPERMGVLTQAMSIAHVIWTHPANRGCRLHALMRSLAWQIYKRVIRRPLTIGFHGKRLVCYPDSTVTSAALYFNGLADYWEMRFLFDYLRAGDQFLDIGANAGVYTLLAASRIGETGRVDAFEPFEGSAQRINEQIRANGLSNVVVHRVAVSDYEGVAEFGFTTDDATLHLRRQTESGKGAVKVQCLPTEPKTVQAARSL